MPKLDSKSRRVSEKQVATALHRTASMMQRRTGTSSSSFSTKKSFRKSGKVEGVIGGVVVGGPQGAERKKFDNLVGATVVNTSNPYVADVLSGIAQGTAVNQRVGDRIHVKGLDVEYNLSISNASTTSNFIDMFIVWDKQPNEALAGANVIFQSTNTNLTFGNTDWLERFQVLRRETYSLDVADRLSATGKWHIPLDLGVRFGSSGDPATGDLLVCALSPDAAAAGSNVTMSYIARVSFTDE